MSPPASAGLPERTARRWIFAAALMTAAVCLGEVALPTVALAKIGQVPVVDGSKFAGLKWTFVRIKYGSYDNEGGAASRLAYWDAGSLVTYWCPTPQQNMSLLTTAAADLGRPMDTRAHLPGAAICRPPHPGLWAFPFHFAM